MTTPHNSRQMVIDRAIAKRHTITDHDVSVSQTLKDVAIDYVQTYEGTRNFVQSLATYLKNHGTLSLAQMRGALNVMISEYNASVALSKGAFHINLPDIPTVVDDRAVDQSD